MWLEARMSPTKLTRPIADAHLHFFSRNYFRLLTMQRGVGDSLDEVRRTVDLLGWELPSESPSAFAQQWLDEMDRHNVGEAAIMSSLPGDEDSVAEAIAKHPNRLFGYFFLNPLAENALDVVRRALAARMKGICLLPAMHRFSLREARVDSVVRMAAENPGTIVFVHCGLLAVGLRGKLGLPSPFDMSYSNPIDLHGLALRYPTVNFVVPHFGAGYFREALILGSLCPNVYFDTSSSNSWIRFQEADMTLTDVFRKAIDVVGPKRLLFGSNSSAFPQGWDASIFEAQWRAFEELGLSDADRNAILGDNLRQLLGVGQAE